MAKSSYCIANGSQRYAPKYSLQKLILIFVLTAAFLSSIGCIWDFPLEKDSDGNGSEYTGGDTSATSTDLGTEINTEKDTGANVNTDTHITDTDSLENTNIDTDTTATLDDYIALFSFFGSPEDLGPHHITLYSSTNKPTLDINRNGDSNASYFFNASNQTFFFNDDFNSPLAVEDALTVSVWVNLANSANDQKIVGRALKSESGSYFGWVLGVSSGLLYSEIWDSTGQRFGMAPGTVPSGEWAHLAITWKTGGRFKGFVNGLVVADMIASSQPIGNVDTAVFRIGARSWSFPNFFVDGNIDDIRIYNKELTEAQIMELKNLPAD
ncbi:MAG: LamG domain-containing protein [Myxococcota bacterium]|nr:LamG domain-containing protein [Myxococcota bacterium]